MARRSKWLAIGFVALFALAVSAVPAKANPIVLTFEGLGNNEAIGNYYNGGTGGSGSGPGPSYGIVFGADALAIISGADGGSGNFSGAPTMPTTMYFLSGPGDVMNVGGGFNTGFSFFYSAIHNPGVVTVYSGLDGTGSVLAALDLPVTPSGGAPQCTYGQFCPFEPFGVSFAGTAMSVDFSGTANQIGFDDITIGSATPDPNSATPEPTTMVLLGSGLAVTALRRRFSSRA